MFSKNLKYYRLMKSLSKKELANKVEVTPMAISNYESGNRIPEMDIMKKIAEVLDVRIADFLVVRNEGIKFCHNEFRKGATLSKEKQELVRESVEEYFSRFMDSVEILGGDVLPNVPQCYTLKISGDAEKDALALRNHLNFALDGPIEDLIGKLENKGFLIFLHEIEDDKFSGINGFVNDRPYIMLNKKMSVERNRSTLVHELAHLMFDWTNSNYDENKIEEYATAIGGAFLFPKVDVIRELGIRRSGITRDMIMVAKEYGISMMMLAKRAEISSVISSFALKHFYVLASQLGWRKNEPSRIAPEKPLLFEQFVYRAINENEISIQRGAELLKIPYAQVASKCCFNEG